MRHACVARERARHPVRLLGRVLAVSVPGFHDWLYRQGHTRVARLMRQDGPRGKTTLTP